MFQIIMRHNGDLFLTAPEREFSLGKRLILQTGKNQETPLHVLHAIDHAVMDVVLQHTSHINLLDISFFDPRDYLGAFEIPHNETLSFISHLLRVEVQNSLSEKIQCNITDQLRLRGIVSFEIIDATAQSV